MKDASCKKEKEKVVKIVLEDEKMKKRGKPSTEKLPITRRSLKQNKTDTKDSILPLLPVKRKPLISRFYNEREEREIVEAYKEAKKIKESFHLAFKYSKGESGVCHASRWSAEQLKPETEGNHPQETKAELLTHLSGKTLRIIVTLPPVS